MFYNLFSYSSHFIRYIYCYSRHASSWLRLNIVSPLIFLPLISFPLVLVSIALDKIILFKVIVEIFGILDFNNAAAHLLHVGLPLKFHSEAILTSKVKT